MSERKIIKTFTLDGDPAKDIDGTEVRVVEMRKATGKDLRNAGRAENADDSDVYLLSKMSGLPAKAFDEIDAPDLMEMLDWLSDYLGKKKPVAGPTS